MTHQQGLLFALFGAILGLLVWGRVRHDLVAVAGLLAGVVLGLVPQEDAFSGFSNEAVIIVALVLVASRALENSGALSLLARGVADGKHGAPTHIALVGGVGAALSAVINNVAALALLMPVDMQAARRAGRPPGTTLMPLAFATVLGGMVTLIGTPPNIIASSIRAERLGAPYHMFDFAPVGLAVAAAGVLFVALIGWRLVPRRNDASGAAPTPASFVAELLVPEELPVIERYGADLDEDTERADVLMLGLVRDGEQHYARARVMSIQAGDALLVEGSAGGIAAFIKAVGLQEALPPDDAAPPAQAKGENDGDEKEAKQEPATPEIVEAVVRSESRLIGRTARQYGMRSRFGITLLGLTHSGVMERTDVRDRTIDAGDLLLLTGRGATDVTLDLLGLIGVSRVGVAPVRPLHIVLAVGLFAGAIALATMGWLSFTVAMAIAVAAYAALGLVPAREFYQQIDWSVVVMLACLLPIGFAFDRVGGTGLVTQWIAGLTSGYGPEVALVALMVTIMALSSVLNNVATMVIGGPIAIDLAERLHVSPDTFLMGVVVAASCAFLTPIGHKNNTLVMGPGQYRFADYWQMGLPLEIVVLIVAVPMLLIVWPL